jgi:hypothetical protein
MSDQPPLATDDTITLPIPAALAARFVTKESDRLAKQRGYSLLRFGTTDLGYWRIDAIASQANEGVPRMVAVLRRVLPS